MLEKCGDDLVAARRFMDLCQDHMSEIFSGKNIPMIEVVRRLSEIQTHAKLMHARSIYRSAQDVIDELTLRKCPQSSASSVLVLQKLIRQYEMGLSEIAPVKIKPKPAKTNPVAELVYDLTRQKKAADTLSPLLKFAGDKDKDNLVALLSLAANESSKPVSAPDVTSVQRIDIILPSLTNHWLRLARTQEKSISVSSALENVFVRTDKLKVLQKGLKQLGEILISQTVESGDKRAEQGFSRSAHLAITGRHTETGFELLTSCEGLTPRTEDIERIKSVLNSIDVTASLEADELLVRVGFSGLSIEKPQTYPENKTVEAAS